MKNADLEKIYKMGEKIPKNFPLNVKEKILRNKYLVANDIMFLKDILGVCSEEEIIEVMERSYEKSSELLFINIEELPDDINELDGDFLEGLFLITN